jgi:type IV pilus assembly protein PilA
MQGFTLVELMLVVAIIAILAAIAIPAYHHYLNKSRVVEAVVLVGPAKMAVTEYAGLHHGNLADISNESLDLSNEELVGNSHNVQSIEIKGTSDTTAAINVELSDSLGELIWTGAFNPATGNIAWNCSYPRDSPIKSYAPAGCLPEGQ